MKLGEMLMITFHVEFIRSILIDAYNISLQYSIYSFLLRFSLYDEDGYAAIKRVVERGEDIATVKPIATVVINYPVISHNR